MPPMDDDDLVFEVDRDDLEIVLDEMGASPLGELLTRLGDALFTESPAPLDEACDILIDVDEHGVWRCQRPAGHEDACFARAEVEIPADHPLAPYVADWQDPV